MATKYLPAGPGFLATTKPLEYINAEASIKFARDLYKKNDFSPEKLINFRLHYAEMSLEVAAELGITFGEAEMSNLRRYVVYEFQRYTDLVGDNGAVVRWGSSARCVVNIKKTDAAISLGGIAGISMATEINSIQNSVAIDGIGIKPGPLAKALPKFSKLDLTTYVELEHAFTKSLPQLMEDDKFLNPTLLGVWGEIFEPEIEFQNIRIALATSYALTEISKRYPLNDSGYFKSSNAEESFKKVAESTFLDFTGLKNIKERPSREIAQKAKRVLKGIETEYED